MSSIAIDLAEALSSVNRPGDFFAHGTAEVLAPGLVVDGVGPIALPLLPVQAEQLIAIAERAPYGRGEETLTDIQVRRTWQIGPDLIRIGAKHWPQTLNKIVTSAAEGLGVTDPVEAELYKMLIYDQGSFFVRHRDTEKSPGMFATLILVLPSISAGGELVVRHKDREERFDLRRDDPAEIAFAAFYADCVHEVLPVTEGYRVALIYNLVRRGPGAPPEPPDHGPQEDVAAGLLRDWTASLEAADDDSPDKLVYPLEHAYTPAELGFQALKGADAGVAKVVVAAAARADCEVHLALVSVYESGSADYSGGYPGHRRGRYDDDEDDDDFEAGEIDERSITVSDWRRPDGEMSPLTSIPVEDGEFSPPDAFEELEPDEEHFHEATGNAGASFERTYSRAALVLWPRTRTLAVINQAGTRVTLPYLADLVERWRASGTGQDSPSWRQAHELSGMMIVSWPTEYWYAQDKKERTNTGEMLDLLARLADPANIGSFLTAIVDRKGFDLGDAAALANALRHLPPEQSAPAIESVIAASAETSLVACAALLADIAARDPAVAAGAANILVDALPGAPARGAWRRGPKVDAGFVVDVIAGLARIDPVLADRATDRILATPVTYDFDTILVLAAQSLIEAPETAGLDAMRRLRSACVAHLETRIAQPLEAPRDWGRANALGCRCQHCAELGRFLADPVNARWIFRAKEADRSHVEGTIRNAVCDVGTTTEKKGSPYSLICTKNQASYERRRRQRTADVADLERLNAV